MVWDIKCERYLFQFKKSEQDNIDSHRTYIL